MPNKIYGNTYKNLLLDRYLGKCWVCECTIDADGIGTEPMFLVLAELYALFNGVMVTPGDGCATSFETFACRFVLPYASPALRADWSFCCANKTQNYTRIIRDWREKLKNVKFDFQIFKCNWIVSYWEFASSTKLSWIKFFFFSSRNLLSSNFLVISSLMASEPRNILDFGRKSKFSVNTKNEPIEEQFYEVRISIYIFQFSFNGKSIHGTRH